MIDKIIDKIIELAKEKLSKKQIVAVVAILGILSIPSTTELMLIVKVVSIVIIASLYQTLQWNIDKEKSNENKVNSSGDVPDVGGGGV